MHEKILNNLRIFCFQNMSEGEIVAQHVCFVWKVTGMMIRLCIQIVLIKWLLSERCLDRKMTVIRILITT